MKPSNRDLLVLSKEASTTQEQLNYEIEKISQLLLHAESLTNFCVVNEIIDINRYRIIHTPSKIKKLVSRGPLKPFQFINNKN